MQEHLLREIEVLYIKQYNMLLAYAIHTLKDDALAEEAVQETFRIACQKADVLHEQKNKEGWLVNTLKYVISNIERVQFRANRSLAEYTALLKRVQEKHDEIDLDIMYKDIALSEEYALIKEYALERKSIRELSEKRGISIAACKKRIQRAKQTLRKCIKF